MTNILQKGRLLLHQFLQNGPLQKDRVEHLGERQLLTMHDFCSRFYAGDNMPIKEIVGVLENLSKSLEIPAGKLRPSDRFLVELAPLKDTWGAVDDTDFSLILLTEHLQKRNGVRIDMTTVKTVDDYIRAACNLPQSAG